MTTKYTVGSQWRTRDGRKATVLANDLRGVYPIVIKFASGINEESYLGLSPEGRLYPSSALDLVKPWSEPVTVQGWINVYAWGCSTIYTRKERADETAELDRIACIYVTGTEGVEP